MDRCECCGQLVEPEGSRPYMAGGLLVRPGFQTVELGGNRVRLSGEQFALFSLIVSRGHVEREEAYREVFCTRKEPHKKIVDVQLCLLRRSLASIGAGGVIETLWGRGWRFNPDNTSPVISAGNLKRKPVGLAC